jgi:hypothetical protein
MNMTIQVSTPVEQEAQQQAAESLHLAFAHLSESTSLEDARQKLRTLAAARFKENAATHGDSFALAVRAERRRMLRNEGMTEAQVDAALPAVEI